VSLRLLYLIFARAAGWVMLLRRSTTAKDAELSRREVVAILVPEAS